MAGPGFDRAVVFDRDPCDLVWRSQFVGDAIWTIQNEGSHAGDHRYREGVFFGLIVSVPVLILGISFLLFFLLNEETREPERVKEILATIGTIDIPVEFDDIEANKMIAQFERIRWQDGTEPETAFGQVRLLKGIKGAQMEGVLLGAMANMKLHSNIVIDRTSRKTEVVRWQFEGKEQDIERTTASATSGDFEVVQYAIRTRQDDASHIFALVACIRKPGRYSEDDIRKIFESFERAK